MNVDNKVMCPWCGSEMRLPPTGCEIDEKSGMRQARYCCINIWCKAGAPLGAWETTESAAIQAAYLAATRRPPNLPLTKEQIMAMQDDAAVWGVSVLRDNEGPDRITVASAAELKELLSDYPYTAFLEGIYFAALPSSADIEAGRKEKV
jgi:hypothetical protein